MPKIVIDIKNAPQKNDVLVYNGIEWEAIPKNKFLFEEHKQIASEQKSLEELKKDIDSTKRQVNQKLKEYHDILKTLTKEDK